jgi:hypothetical protein
MSQVLGIVYRAIVTHLVRKAGLAHATVQTGAVTLIQRFSVNNSVRKVGNGSLRLRFRSFRCAWPGAAEWPRIYSLELKVRSMAAKLAVQTSATRLPCRSSSDRG